MNAVNTYPLYLFSLKILILVNEPTTKFKFIPLWNLLLILHRILRNYVYVSTFNSPKISAVEAIPELSWLRHRTMRLVSNFDSIRNDIILIDSGLFILSTSIETKKLYGVTLHALRTIPPRIKITVSKLFL